MTFNSVEYSFRRADKDNKGFLTPVEFSSALEQMTI